MIPTIKQNTENTTKDAFFKVKTKDGKFDKIEIDKVKFLDKLKELGFYRLDLDTETFVYVRIIGGIIKQVSENQIIDCFEDYITLLGTTKHKTTEITKEGEPLEIELDVTPNALIKKLYDTLEIYFKDKLLSRLRPSKEIVIKKDTETEKFIYYLNGFVTITKDGHTFSTYDKIDGFVWENMVLQRNFEEADDKTSYIERFFRNIAARRNDENEIEHDYARLAQLRTMTGYLLHGFTDKKLFSIILTDSKMSYDDEPNGRTGKTLYGKILAQMLNTRKGSSVFTELSGKNFDIKNDKRYQECNLDTQLIHLNDLKKGFNIEDLFNDITEGVDVRKMYKSPFKVNVKIIISTNKTIKIEGESAKDRCKIFEFSDYYSSQFSPENEFKHWFFRDWNAIEWNRFDLFMINCVRDFLKDGISTAAGVNIERRMLQDHTSSDFVIWFTDYIVNKALPECEIYHEHKADKKQMYDDFLEAYTDYQAEAKIGRFKQAKFTKWLRTFSKNNTYIKPIVTETDEIRSNGKDYIMMRKK